MGDPRIRTGGKPLLTALIAAAVMFVALSAGLYFACQFTLAHSTFRLSRIAAGDIHVDVLVAGNSRGVGLLNEAPSVFDLSYNAFGRETTLAWIKTFFRRGNTAKTIVIEATTLYDEYPSCDAKPFWAIYPGMFEVRRGACSEDASVARFFPLTVFDSEQFLRALYYVVVNRAGDQGWAADYGISSDLCARLPLKDVYHFRDEADRVDIAAVRREIADLKQWLARRGHKARIVFVLAPMFANRHDMPAIAEIRKVDVKLLAGSDVLDYATAFGSDCSDFADSIHIGGKGRAKLMPELLASLADPR